VIDVHIAGESRRGDVLFTERRARPALRRRLGMLGELARGELLLEAFRNAVGEFEFKVCVTQLARGSYGVGASTVRLIASIIAFTLPWKAAMKASSSTPSGRSNVASQSIALPAPSGRTATRAR